MKYVTRRQAIDAGCCTSEVDIFAAGRTRVSVQVILKSSKTFRYQKLCAILYATGLSVKFASSCAVAAKEYNTAGGASLHVAHCVDAAANADYWAGYLEDSADGALLSAREATKSALHAVNAAVDGPRPRVREPGVLYVYTLDAENAELARQNKWLLDHMED